MRNVSSVLGTCIFTVLLAVAAGEASPRPVLFDRLPFVGFSFDWSQRRGYRDFGSGTVVERDCPELWTWGGIAGKRWSLGRKFPLRLQAAGSVNFGSVAEDTLPAGIEYPYDGIVKRRYVDIAGIADLQYPIVLPDMGRLPLFLHAGAGLHFTRVTEKEVYLAKPSQETPAGDPYLENTPLMVSGSVHGGIGFETMVSPALGIAVTYSFRYWYPVHYKEKRDMYPFSGVPSSERFLTHVFDIVLLIR
jgi:hypothetical protein